LFNYLFIVVIWWNRWSVLVVLTTLYCICYWVAVDWCSQEGWRGCSLCGT